MDGHIQKIISHIFLDKDLQRHERYNILIYRFNVTSEVLFKLTALTTDFIVWLKIIPQFWSGGEYTFNFLHLGSSNIVLVPRFVHLGSIIVLTLYSAIQSFATNIYQIWQTFNLLYTTSNMSKQLALKLFQTVHMMIPYT